MSALDTAQQKQTRIIQPEHARRHRRRKLHTTGLFTLGCTNLGRKALEVFLALPTHTQPCPMQPGHSSNDTSHRYVTKDINAKPRPSSWICPPTQHKLTKIVTASRQIQPQQPSLPTALIQRWESCHWFLQHPRAKRQLEHDAPQKTNPRYNHLREQSSLKTLPLRQASAHQI
ncbi:unnamed protein product [Ectocarpus sp. 12 AP-2014]